MAADDAIALLCHRTSVHGDRVDYNGHMNDAAYAAVFSEATDALLEWLGIDAVFRAEHRFTVFTLETHICYLEQAREGQGLAVGVRLVDRDAKRLHVLMSLQEVASGTELATGEIMLMGIDTAAERPAPFPDTLTDALDTFERRHGVAEPPREAGRSIGIRR